MPVPERGWHLSKGGDPILYWEDPNYSATDRRGISRGVAVTIDILIACPICGVEFKIPYVLIGAPISCVSCDSLFISEVGPSTIFPEDSKYELRFAGFQSLAENELKATAEYFKESLRYTIGRESKRVMFRNEKQELVDPIMIHLEIQSDPKLQLKIYRLAMSLWRF
jgi:hypothetical protein